MARSSPRPGGLCLLAPLAGLLAAGCGDDAAGEDAEAACAYAVCAIEDPDCVTQIAEDVACHLGLEVIQPEVRFLSAAEYLAEREAEATPLTAEQVMDRDDYYRTVALLGLMPEGYAPEDLGADSIKSFVAFYAPDRKQIWMIRDRITGDPDTDYLIMVHEMLHAYQDATWDLAALHEANAYTFDRFLGQRALIEGHAVHFENLASVELANVDPLQVNWSTYYGDWQSKVLERASETETPELDVLSLLPYAFGGALVLDAWQEGGADRIAELWDRPPDSTRQAMAGTWAWPDERVNEDHALDPQAVATLPSSYTLLSGGHDGVWMLNAMMERTAQSGPWGSALDEVSADYLTTWRWNQDDVVAIWRLRSADPNNFVTAMTASGGRWVASDPDDPLGHATTHLVTTIDGDVLLIAVSSGDARTVLAEIAGWRSIDEVVADGSAAQIRRSGLLDSQRLACAHLPR